MYNIEQLSNENLSCKQPITEAVLEKVNELIQFRNSLDYSIPQVGDIVVYEDINGDISPHAHIDSIKDGKLHLCKHPYTPFVSMSFKDKSLSTSTSGGDWTTVYIEDLKEENQDTADKLFCSFFNKPGANSAVHFNLKVKVWKYKERRSHKEQLFESVSSKRVPVLLDEISKTKPNDIYEALKIFRQAFEWDRCFTFSPMFEEDKHAFIKLFDNYEIYCYCDTEKIWSIFCNTDFK